MTLNAKIKIFIYSFRFLTATHISWTNCAEIARDSLEKPAYKTFSIKRSFHYFKFCPLRSRNSPYGASNLGTPLRIFAFGHSNGSSHARRWRHLAYVNVSYSMSVAGIGELIDFVRSGPSNMHRCRAFPFAFLCILTYSLNTRSQTRPNEAQGQECWGQKCTSSF